MNWHLTLLLEHSEQLDVSVASHFTLRSRQASQDGSFLRCRYARLVADKPPERCVGEIPEADRVASGSVSWMLPGRLPAAVLGEVDEFP